MALVERNRRSILGIDDEHEGGNVELDRPGYGIREHRRPEAASLQAPADGQPPNAKRRYGRVTR